MTDEDSTHPSSYQESLSDSDADDESSGSCASSDESPESTDDEDESSTEYVIPPNYKYVLPWSNCGVWFARGGAKVYYRGKKQNKTFSGTPQQMFQFIANDRIQPKAIADFYAKTKTRLANVMTINKRDDDYDLRL